eukprot:g19266.t1
MDVFCPPDGMNYCVLPCSVMSELYHGHTYRFYCHYPDLDVTFYSYDSPPSGLFLALATGVNLWYGLSELGLSHASLLCSSALV